MTPLRRVAIALIRGYQWVLSPVLPMSCRFEPTCSHYACEAIARHGPLYGAGLALWRILRCNPWGGCGFDPVPERRISIKHVLPGGSSPDRATGGHDARQARF